MYILRKLSTDNGDSSREYNTLDEAHEIMVSEYTATRTEFDATYITDDEAELGDDTSGHFVGWLIYKKPEETDVIAKLGITLRLAEMGLAQYNYELLDRDVCGNYISEAIAMLELLKQSQASLTEKERGRR